MSLSTLKEVVTHPFGTARLVEGFCTLHRADLAGITPAQMRATYLDLADCSDSEIRGFTKIGAKLVRGDARFPGRAFVEVDSSDSVVG